METLLKGVYEQGKVSLEKKADLKDGSNVIVIPISDGDTQIDIAHLLAQQRALGKFWADEGEDLYGKI